MKLLIISHWFPPTNAIGAVRVGKLAAWLHRRGHEVRVLAGPAFDSDGIALEIPTEHVTRPPAPSPGQPGQPGTPSRLRVWLARHRLALATIPDKQHDWRGPGLAQGEQILASFRPDLILASAPPYTGFLIAAELGRRHAIPWVADIRDIWADSPYCDDPLWRQWVDRWLERRTLRQAAALVTISPLDTQALQRRYPQPATTVLNGISPEDIPPPEPIAPHQRLRILYTGAIYAGHRDPSPLFAALALLPPEQRARIEVAFHGPRGELARALAARHGVAEQVAVRASVPYREALRLQAQADVLLLLQRNNADDASNIPAKFFEYLAARRPILLLGCDSGVVAGMMRARAAGLVSNDPSEIAASLAAWLASLPAGPALLPISVQQGLYRAEQFERYEAFLTELLGSSSLGSPTRPPNAPVK